VSLYSLVELTGNKTISYKELKVKHLKIIYKCLLGDDIDNILLFNNLNNILSKLTKQNVENFNFIDFFILLIDIRCSSISNIITLQVSENTTFDLNLNKVLEEIKKINLQDLLEPEFCDDIVLYYKMPSILEIHKLNINPEVSYDLFLEKIKIKENEIIFESKEQKEEVIKRLPAKLFSLVIKRTKKIIEHFNTINLLDYNKQNIKDINLFFNFNINNLSNFIKLLFGNHLMTLYENIFALAKIGKIPPEYTENCTPGEYLLFIKKLEEMNKSSSKQSSDEILNNSFEEPVDDDPVNPYERDDLPPITSEFTG
jgi:hypothetical protein